MSEDSKKSENPNWVRIDRPHAAQNDTVETSAAKNTVAQTTTAAGGTAVPQTNAGGAAIRELSQVRTQATQLATHMQSMREELDHRESQLNAREVRTDSDMRAARLWLRERESELDDRSEELDRREKTLANSMSCLVADEESKKSSNDAEATELRAKIRQATEQLRSDRNQHDAELLAKQQELQQRRNATKALGRKLLKNLERHRVAIEAEAARRREQIEVEQQQNFDRKFKQTREQLEQRQAKLDAAEALLINSQADLEVQQQQLIMRRQRVEAELHEHRAELVRQQRQLDDKWQQRQKMLARRDEQLESRQSALEQTRCDVAATHREALELRLATEELWAKLAEIMPAASLTTELGKLRRKLAESYCLERSASLGQTQQLEASHERLAEQYVKLTAEKKELRDWVEYRQQDIERQAAVLVAREQELDRQETETSRQQEQWEIERRNYQTEIRGLMTELRRGGEPARSKPADITPAAV